MKKILNDLPFTAGLMRVARPLYATLRTSYLQTRYPRGGFVRCNGVRVFCNFHHKSHTWYCGNSPYLQFDQHVIRSLVQQTEGNVFIDIGAHFGFFTAYLAGILKPRSGRSRILALEPDRDNFRCLNLTMQPHAQMDLELLPYAIARQDGTAVMYRTDADCLHSYSEPSAESCYEVTAISLDSLVGKHVQAGDKVALIKIDVDGSEPDFFVGGEEVMCGHRPIVFMEFAPSVLVRAGHDPREMYRTLCERFHVYWASQSLREVRPVGPRDFISIAEEVADRVTDLVISSVALDWSKLPGARVSMP